MMTRSEGKQCRLQAVTMEELVPQDHFLRKLDAAISFDFVYELVSPLYSSRGRPSIDPVLLVKMLLIGYLFGIDSERKLVEDVRYHIAYRWYLGLDLDAPVPNHSTFSQNRRRRYHGTEIFRQIFEEIVRRCQEAGLVKGESVVMDSTHIKANADNHVSEWVDVTIRPEAYWTELDDGEETKPVLPERAIRKAKNPHDPDAGYMNRTNKPKGFYYLAHECSDADTGTILDVHVTGGDTQDCECCVERYEYLKTKKQYPIQSAGLDSGYDTIAIHYGLTRLGIEAFIRPCQRGARSASKWFVHEDFQWDAERNIYICPNGCTLSFRWITRPRNSQPCFIYVASNDDCRHCPYKSSCIPPKKSHREIMRKILVSYQDEGRGRVGNTEYKHILQRRQIVCEGNFALQKRCHNLRFTRKRGIENVLEQCLLSASALNLKRLIKHIQNTDLPSGRERELTFVGWIFLLSRKK